MSIVSRRQIQILHVDDEPDFADLTGTLLQNEDDQFHVETATSADEGLAKINERRPDCIVSDYNMPGMDGLEFLGAVREEYPDLPFILFTGQGSESIASDAIAADVTDYLQKGAGSEQFELLANRLRNAVQARREAQRADRQEQLMRLTEFAGDTGGFELDRESDTVLLTAGTRRIIGRPDRHEIPLTEAIELFHPDDREEIRQTIIRAFQTGEDIDTRWRLQPRDGEERLLDVTIIPVAENGDVTKLRGAGHDITDRNERQRELEQIETLFEHAQDSLFLLDVDEEFTVKRVNPAYEDATGLAVDEVRGQTPRDILGEKGGAVAESKYRECVERREPLQYEETASVDGAVTQWVTRIAPVVVDGTVEYIAGSTQDVTEQKKRQQDLEQARDLMANMEELADAGAWEYDSKTDRLMITDGTRRLYGLGPDEGLTLEASLDSVHPDDRDMLTDRLNNCLQTGEPYDIDIRFTAPDGAQRWLAAQGERVSESEAGSVVRGYIRDITEQRAFERDLKRYRTVFNELPEPVVVYDEDGRYDLINDAAVELRDIPREELTGTKSPYLEQIQDEHPAKYDALLRGERETLRTELTDDFPGRGKRTLACELFRVPARTGTVGTAIVTRDITDRKQRRQELEEYETIIQTLTDAVYVLDEQGRFTYVNDRFVELVDYDRETILGNTPSLIKNAAAVDQAETQLGRVLSSDGPDTVTFEVMVQPRDGDSVLCEDHMGALPYEGDRFEGSVGTLRDVTHVKERERRLERQNDMFKKAQDIADVGAWSYDRLTDEWFFTEKTYGIHGLSPDDELDPEKSLSMYHPDDQPTIRDAFNRAVETGEPYDLELRLIDATDTLRWVRTRGDPETEDGNVVRIRGTIQDITERKEQERELEDRTEELDALTTDLEEQYRHLFEAAPVMAVVTRAEDGRPIIEDCNRLFVETLGLEKSAVVGEELAEFYTADSQHRLLEEGGYDRALSGDFVRENRALVTADGETVETLLRGVPRDDAYEDTRGTLNFYIDISERKQLERERDRLSEFTSIVSHDLRSPLTVADGNIELAQKECNSTHLTQAADAIDRSHALIEDLLTLAREGDEVTESESISLANLAQRSWETVETPQATLDIDTTRVIQADGSRLQQLFENLYRNAIEHSSEDVTVSVGTIDDGFCVADSGPGIPESDREEVFEAGYSTNENGTGFGLRIVKQIADAHGWGVTVTESEQGGARFEFTGVGRVDR